MYNQELGVAYYRVAVVKSAVKQDYLVCVEFVVVALDSNFEGASQAQQISWQWSVSSN